MYYPKTWTIYHFQPYCKFNVLEAVKPIILYVHLSQVKSELKLIDGKERRFHQKYVKPEMVNILKQLTEKNFSLKHILFVSVFPNKGFRHP